MTSILIIGLGLIGGSYAMGLKKAGYKVFGVDKNEEAVNCALNLGYIDAGGVDPTVFFPSADWIIIGLYPKDIIPFLTQHKESLLPKHKITDVCGIKGNICLRASKIVHPARFIGSHPIAGKEKKGIGFADSKIFSGANFIICPLSDADLDLVNELSVIARELGFSKISITTPEKHDELIAYTSQLTHAMAIGLVNSYDGNAKDFIGDSYRDLTRIALINEELWSDLFLGNKEFLLDEINIFIDEMNQIKEAIENNDSLSLKEIFIKAKKKRELM